MLRQSKFVGSSGNAEPQLGHLLAELGLSVPRGGEITLDWVNVIVNF